MNGPLSKEQIEQARLIWGGEKHFKSKKVMKNLRMYHFVMYNLSGIQKGIQSYHAGVEYSRKFPNNEAFAQWADYDKTVIILDGGGSNDMIKRMEELRELGVDYATFMEPDLNMSLSAIAFLVDDSIYDFKSPEDEMEILEVGTERYGMYRVYQYLKSFRLAAN